MNKPIIEGLMVSILSDNGPQTVYNLSSLDEITAQKLSILGMTIILMGSGDSDDRKRRYFKIHGPIPVPDMYIFETLCLPFNVNADLGTGDARIGIHGREYMLWFLFNTSNREQALSNVKEIEEITKDHIKFLRTESQLIDEKIYVSLLEKIQKLYINIDNISIQTPDSIQPYKLEYGQYGIFTISSSGTIIPVFEYNSIHSLDVLIVVNIIEKRINILKINPKLSQQIIYNVNHIKNRYNSEKFKSEFKIRNITDELEVQLIMDKISNIYHGVESKTSS